MKPFDTIKLKYQDQISRIAHGGPDDHEYQFLNEYFNEIMHLRDNTLLNSDNIGEARTWFNGSMSTPNTLQGHVCIKPRGYAGDFEIIDKIYQFHTSSDKVEAKWDRFFHTGAASKAVRNRKQYVIQKLNELPEHAEVLNLACGPCRDILEFAQQSEKQLSFNHIDMDLDAIQFSKSLLHKTKTIANSFVQTNVFRFIPTKQYDFIWSAGLFDYLDDLVLTRLLLRFSLYIKPGGKMIIGNFGPDNSSRAYMEFGDWFLHHRSHDQLMTLTDKIQCQSKHIESEPEGVNLFLVLKF